MGTATGVAWGRDGVGMGMGSGMGMGTGMGVAMRTGAADEVEWSNR